VQKFVGVRADGDHGRMTDMALTAFLNTHHHSYPHVPTPVYGSGEYDRGPLIRKLQNFLLAHADMTAAVEHKVVENGEFDEPTVKALQQLLNHVNLGDEFEAAAIVYESECALMRIEPRGVRFDIPTRVRAAPTVVQHNAMGTLTRHATPDRPQARFIGFLSLCRRRAAAAPEPAAWHRSWRCAVRSGRVQLQL
jgi:hypothetical protein